MTKIFIDAGHGGTDPGATGNGLKEKDLTLTIAKKVQSLLRGVATINMSRTTDKYLSLTERTNMANSWGSDYFLSIHINAGGGTGYEDYIYNGNVSSKTVSIRDTIHANIIKSIPNVVNRGKKRANFAVVRQTRMPAILTENLFIDRKSDADLLKSDAFLNEIAQGHANGIIKAFGLGEPKESAPITSTPPKKQTGNNRIRTIQSTLNSRYNSKIAVDGFDGPLTKKALIKAYQTELNKQYNAGLVVDGKWGPKTATASVTVRKGAKGNLTWIIQARLYCLGYDPKGLDSIFGNGLETVIKEFQKDKKISQDGVAGKATFAKLFG